MKHVKSFALFESETELTGEQKAFLDRHTKGSWSVNPETGLVDVDGDFYFHGEKLKTLLGLKFGVVSGDFNCSGNKLTTLDGSPREVKRSFDCSYNELTSLKGGPQEVRGNFKCHYNQTFLTSLKGAPREVGGSFDCSSNSLTSLEGAPKKIGGDFLCSHNQLTTLKGAPQEVGEGFFCPKNHNLTSLEGAPLKIGWYFYLGYDSKLRWTTEGKLEYMTKNPEWISLILPTLPYDSLVATVSESPTLLKTIEDFDKVLYNKVLKDLGWDKMGPDLLRQLKDGML